MPEVTRNNKVLNFELTKVLKGKSKGAEFYGTKVTEENLFDVIEWIEKKQAAALLNATMRLRSKEWSAEAEEESKGQDGVIDRQKYDEVFVAMAQDFSARGETIKELESQIADMVEEIGNLDYTVPTAIPRVQELSTEIKKLQIAIQSKRRKTSDEENSVAA